MNRFEAKLTLDSVSIIVALIRGHPDQKQLSKFMPLTISRRKLAPAWGDCNAITVSRRLAGVPTLRTGTNEHVYLLAAVLPRVKKAEHIAPLFAAATDDSSLYVGSGAVNYALAELLDRWLSGEMRARYQRVRASMVAGLAGARGGAAYLPMIELIQLKSRSIIAYPAGLLSGMACAPAM